MGWMWKIYDNKPDIPFQPIIINQESIDNTVDKQKSICRLTTKNDIQKSFKNCNLISIQTYKWHVSYQTTYSPHFSNKKDKRDQLKRAI